MTSFASCTSLEVRKPASEITDLEAILIQCLMDDWKNEYNTASNSSHRGNLRLEEWLEDENITLELMSERMKRIRSYGMVELMQVQA